MDVYRLCGMYVLGGGRGRETDVYLEDGWAWMDLPLHPSEKEKGGRDETNQSKTIVNII